MTTVALGEAAEIVSGATPKTGVPGFWDGDVAWATPADLSKLDGAYISVTPRTITLAGLASCAATVLPVGSVLLSSRAPIGHVALNTVPMATNQGFKSLIPKPDVLDGKYLFHWLRANTDYLQSLGNGATFKELSKATVSRIEVPAPPVQEQRRIAAILDRADALRAKRRQSLALLDGLTQSVFVDTFGDATASHVLGDHAAVQGGLQVSGKRSALPAHAPYLRVANVHRGRLDLREVKTIRATPAEIERTRLQWGDLLFVEGHANELEVGRAAAWDGSVDGCVHQNHLIRARCDHSSLLPEFAVAWFSSPDGAAHFRRAAKTTSGLNTISSATVKSAPLLLPPMADQEKFVALVCGVGDRRRLAEQGLVALNEQFASLQSQAFSGRL